MTPKNRYYKWQQEQRLFLPECPKGCKFPHYSTTVIRHSCSQKNIDNYRCLACNWEESVVDYIHNPVNEATQLPDISLEDIEKSEQMLKESLFTVGHIAGLTNEQIETDWQRIKLEASSKDIHIEEL